MAAGCMVPSQKTSVAAVQAGTDDEEGTVIAQRALHKRTWLPVTTLEAPRACMAWMTSPEQPAERPRGSKHTKRCRGKDIHSSSSSSYRTLLRLWYES